MVVHSQKFISLLNWENWKKKQLENSEFDEEILVSNNNNK